MKFFDKLQKIIAIIGIACFVLSIAFLIWNSIVATPIYDESGALKEYQYEKVPSTLLSIFAFLHIASIVWFVARSSTYKMRQKEEQEDEEGY